MRPMIQRVSDKTRHAAGKCAELLIVRRIAGDILLVDAAGAHCAPLVVIAAEPQLGYVREAAVFRDLARRDMTVIINYRQPLRIGVVELSRRLGIEQKFFSHKAFHFICSPFLPRC